MQISAPTNFDFKIIKKLKGKIYSSYGSLNDNAQESIVPGYALPIISVEKLKEYVTYSHSSGIKFSYIMNHPNIRLDKGRITLLDKLNEINVDTITASNPKLITFLKKEYPFEIYSSIACRINSIESALTYKDFGCDVLCLDYSKNYDLEFIRLVKEETKVKIMILANNICLPDCPYKEEHFKDSEYLEKAPIKCLKLKLEDTTLIKKTGFIHPNDVKKYEEVGVDFIKLGGRPKPTWWIINCVEAYYKNDYKGNCFELMNSLGSEHRYPAILENLLTSLPDFFISQGFKYLYYLTNKKIFKLLSREKNIKHLLRLSLAKDFFYVDDKKISIGQKKKEYLLKEINKILENSGVS